MKVKKRIKRILETIAWILGLIVIGIAIYGVVTTFLK